MANPKIILLIDDEADLVMMMKTVLEGAGYHVITAHDGEEGLQKLSQVRPHLIILDVNMPKMDGATFYEHIYDKVEKKVKYPVLVLTARANMEALFRKLDVDGFMAKPLEIEHLLKEIEIIMIKRYGDPDLIRKRQARRSKKVLLIENNETIFDKVVLAFANQGYTLITARRGTEGIERAITEQPEVILVALGLSDLPGDIVASKLRQMPKTMDIPIIVFTEEDDRRNDSGPEALWEKMGVKKVVLSSDPQGLLTEARNLLAQIEEQKGILKKNIPPYNASKNDAPQNNIPIQDMGKNFPDKSGPE